MPTVKFQLRRDTAANWTSINPTLGSGEPALETDTRRQKIGDGSTAWTDLPYIPDGTVRSVSAASSSAGFSLSGGPITQAGEIIFAVTSPSDARVSLGLGSVATLNTGTSGATVPRNDTANVFSAAQVISHPSGSSIQVIQSIGGQAAEIRLRTGSSERWRILKNNLAEAGENAGSDFAILRYNDSGAQLGTSVYISRATGEISLGGSTKPTADNSSPLGSASNRWSVIYAGTGAINTSDLRMKREIRPLPDQLLDAWANVNWVSYRFEEAILAKGERARWHFGLIAQEVMAEIDKVLGAGAAVQLGIVCHDEWPEAPEISRPVVVERETGELDSSGAPICEFVETGEVEIIQDYRPAGDRWGLRYDECFAIEAAYQRRQAKRLEEKIDDLASSRRP